MLQDRYETDKLFDSILQLTHQMDAVLAEIDQLLEDEALYQLIRADLAKRFPLTEQTGRSSTPVEVVLRMLAVRRLYGLSYEQTEYQVRDSLVLRQFCRVYFNEVPDDTTLIRWASLIQPQTLEDFNRRLTQLATQLKVTKGRKLRTDGTVVETNIHKLDLTVHLKTEEQPEGQYTFRVDLYYDQDVQHSLQESIRLPEDIPVTG